ncbi:MAG: glycosyltransferase family 2 protein [Ignavibacteria bacterium]
MIIFIIIPVHNRKQFTFNCLTALINQTNKNFYIVVIDDGSTDGTSEMIKDHFKDVILLKGDGNLWWSGATNLGVKYALKNNASYIMTLNDDTVPCEDFMENMFHWAQEMPNALLGALALNANTGQPDYGGELLSWKTAGYTKLLNLLKKDEQKGIHPVTHYPGRGLLIPAAVFNKIGFYDEKNFPQAVADDDFAHRAKRAGYNIYCNYDAKLFTYPEESAIIKLRQKKNIKNYYSHLFGLKGGGNLKYFTIYALKNCPPKYILLFLPIGIIRRVLGYPKEWALDYIKGRHLKWKQFIVDFLNK